MKLGRICLIGVLISVAASGALAARQSAAPRVKALVGGLLIDGYAGPPIQNSVILIEGDKIAAVGQVGKLAIPSGADVISTEGMTVLPGLWDMHVHTMLVGHADYEHWDKAYLPQFESVIMPASAIFRTFARPSSGPCTPHRYASVFGYGSCWMNGPAT